MTTKAAVLVLVSTSVAAGTVKTAPVAGAAIDLRTYPGGDLGLKITNGASAPGVACTITVQSSHDGATWYDYYSISGDTTASSINSQTIWIDVGVMYLRAIAYGNTTNNVTVEAYLQAVTAA